MCLEAKVVNFDYNREENTFYGITEKAHYPMFNFNVYFS